MRLWSVVELISFAAIAVGVGGQFGLWWGVIAGGVLGAIWAGANELLSADRRSR
ncbi:MAG TPA: hypothetical protein VF377_10550 [Acidimicrobiia bacterium]